MSLAIIVFNGHSVTQIPTLSKHSDQNTLYFKCSSLHQVVLLTRCPIQLHPTEEFPLWTAVGEAIRWTESTLYCQQFNQNREPTKHNKSLHKVVLLQSVVIGKSACLSICQPVCPSVSLSVHLSVCLSVCLSVNTYIFIYQHYSTAI